eukprot:COSAG02_NODE_224_length_28285_cov_39.533066_11_plen_147_part_00
MMMMMMMMMMFEETATGLRSVSNKTESRRFKTESRRGPSQKNPNEPPPPPSRLPSIAPPPLPLVCHQRAPYQDPCSFFLAGRLCIAGNDSTWRDKISVLVEGAPKWACMGQNRIGRSASETFSTWITAIMLPTIDELVLSKFQLVL